MDKQGRILIAAKLRDEAMLEKDDELVGLRSKTDSWTKNRCEENNSYDNRDDIVENMKIR